MLSVSSRFKAADVLYVFHFVDTVVPAGRQQAEDIHDGKIENIWRFINIQPIQGDVISFVYHLDRSNTE